MPKVYIPGETKAQRKSRKKAEKARRNQEIKVASRIAPTVPKPKPPEKAPNENHQIKKTDTVFVLGNGTSRKPIALEPLKSHGTIYGCNALFREFTPDYLIAVDTKMVREISHNAYQMYNQVWSNPNKYTRSVERLNLFNPNLGWSSGPTALNMASLQGPKEVYILGFDYQGLGRRNELVNNIYAGTPHYKPKNNEPMYFGNWVEQLNKIMATAPNKRFMQVNPLNNFTDDSLRKNPNFETITLDEFKRMINKT